jgi:tetratricopeptide (TPR) repeat protein
VVRTRAAAERAYKTAMGRLRAGRTVSTPLARALRKHGWELQKEGRYRDAARVLRAAVRCAGQASGPDSVDTARALNALAVCYKYLARFEDAHALYQRALAIATARRAGNPFLATLHHNLGGLAHAAGRAADGEPFGRESVRLRTEALGPDHPEVAADLAALGGLLDQQRKFTEAERLYRRAIRIFSRTLGRDHIELATSLNNLAAIAHTRRRYRQAETMYRRAYRITLAHHGDDHPQAAVIANNLAAVLLARGRLDEADDWSGHAVRILERRLGRTHPQVALCRANRARLRKTRLARGHGPRRSG